jgi:hypothetical protein
MSINLATDKIDIHLAGGMAREGRRSSQTVFNCPTPPAFKLSRRKERVRSNLAGAKTLAQALSEGCIGKAARRLADGKD